MAATDISPSSREALLGVAFVVLGVSVAASGDAVAKFLGQDLPVAALVWGRYLFSTVVVLPFVLGRIPLVQFLACATWIEALRAISMLLVTGAYFTAIQYLPLADALGLLLLYPLLASALAALLLDERVGLAKALVMATAFGGALLVVKPGFATWNVGVGFALAAALAVAVNIVITRHLAGRTPIVVGLLYSNLAGLVLSSPFVAFDWRPPSSAEWALLAALGVLMAAATFLIYRAYGSAPTATLAPFGYSEVIAATILGYVVFSDFPDAASILGIAVICACGIWIAMRGRG